MIPFLVTFASMFWAAIPALAIAVIVFIIVYSRLKKSDSSNQLGKSLGISAIVLILSICLVSFIISAWAFSGPPAPFLNPDLNDMAGTWYISTDAIEYLDSEGVQATSYEFNLYPDGSFTMNNIPDPWGPFNSNDPPHSGYGTWDIRRGMQRGWVVKLKYQDSVNYSNNYAELHIEGRFPPYTLYVWKGEFRRFVFNRR